MNRLDRIAQLESTQYTKSDLAEMVVKLEEATKHKPAAESEIAEKYEGVILINGLVPGRSRLFFEGKEIKDYETIRLFVDSERNSTTLSMQHPDKVVSFLKGQPSRFNSKIHYNRLAAMPVEEREKKLDLMTNKSLRYLVNQMLAVIFDLKATVKKKTHQLAEYHNQEKVKQ
ncbi:hypothetical protein SAMN05421503_2434 [Terribacillus aidingensis]|uniref:Uncharacterized protein n=1 Tax=Terribacillus aidingensis TaxID=586416 RepID=A0A285NYE6_9BACI|nr:hypothetical protein [Terribacillus aidingensis]SNZ14512.1 hypothetical protein SAMN05421503_2434 [Terribacillus aidingensis]